MRPGIYSLFALLLVAAGDGATEAQERPPLAPGQRVHITIQVEPQAPISFLASVCRVDETLVTLQVLRIEGDRKDQAQVSRSSERGVQDPWNSERRIEQGDMVDVPLSNVVSYEIERRKASAQLYVSIIVLSLLAVLAGICLVKILTLDPEQRRQRWEAATPALMTLLGAFAGLFTGAIISSILNLKEYVYTFYGGNNPEAGLPAEPTMVLVCAVAGGCLFFHLAKRRQTRRHQQGAGSTTHK